MSEKDREDDTPARDTEQPTADAGTETGQSAQESAKPAGGPNVNETPEGGPTFAETPDPLAGVRRWTAGVWASMGGKTVSLRTYVGTIVGVIILTMLARCGG